MLLEISERTRKDFDIFMLETMCYRYNATKTIYHPSNKRTELIILG